MADQTTLESLQGLKEFQDSDFSTRLGWVDNFSNLMFKEGRMDEAQKALDFRTQLEVQGASQEPVNQIMGSLMPNVRSIFTGAAEEPTLVDTLGEERYNQINQSYSRAKDMLESEGQPVKIGEDFVFVQKNPFGSGSLLKYEGGTKFLEDAQSGPEAVKQLTEAEKLAPIKKDKVYGDLVNELTPDFNAETVLQKDTVSSLISDPRFSALSMGDQRSLLRYQRLALKNMGTTTEMEVANQALEMLNREEEGMLAAGEMAGPLRETKLLNPATWNWYQNSWERGIQRAMLEADKREMRASFSARDALRKSSTPEELAAFDRNSDLINEISNQFYEGIGADPWAPGELERQLVGTGLEGVPKSKVVAYARAATGFKKHEQNYILRNKAIGMIPQLEGMKQFQGNQGRLEAEGATWQEKSAQGVKDFAANPLDTVVAATLESFVSQPVSTVGTAALFAIPGGQGAGGAVVATRLAQATGSGLLAASTESSFTWTDEFEKARRLPDGSERPIEEILADPIAIKEINDKALGRGAAIGTVQGVTGWILPGSMNALDRFFASRGARAWQQGVFAGTQALTQAGSEGGGELLAQQTEWDTNVGEVLLEMAAGFGGPDTLTMWQAPEAMRQARQDVRLETEANRILNEAKAVAAAREEISPEAVVTQSQEIQGIFAQDIALQIETGEVDAKGNQEIHVFYETDEVGPEPSPEATVNQGLETVEPIVTETQEEAVQAEPIQDVSQIQEDQTVSVINDDGSVTSGPAKFNPAGNLVIDGKVQKTFPGKVWNGEVQPKPKPNLSRGDVLFDGNSFYEYDDAKDDYIIGQKNQDGTIQFDSTERANLTDGFVRDPRVTAYAKADFDSALQEYNATPGEKFGEILRRTPQKGQEGASSDTEVQSATAPVPTPTEGAPKGPTEAELNEQAQTPVLQSPVGKRRTTAFKLRAHKDVNTLLGKAVDRFQDWMKRTKVLEKQENFIRYAKDGRVQELHRTQDPENFDERVNQLTEEDQDFRNYREPTKWNEVEHYRKLEVFLRNRIKRTQQSTNAKKSDKGILESAQVDSILQALFIQDRAIAATVSARFALYSPNGSLITVEDVAQLRYGSVESWKNPNSFTKTKAAYNSLARTLMLGGNASVVDVFHELYHDYLSNIAPLVLTEGQFNRLQKYIEARMAQPRFREFMRKSYKLKDTDFVFYQDGQISEAAQEAFTQMLTRWHYDGRLSQGMEEQDVPVLEAISGFFQRTFQDLDRTPITVTTDDAADLLGNFFLVPPSLRRQAFTPDTRRRRIDNEMAEQDLNLEQLAAGIAGELDYEPTETATLPAAPQITGDKLVDTYYPGEQPRDGVPITSAGRSYVEEDGVTYEIIHTPVGVLKIPRDEQEQAFDGQTEHPQVEYAGVAYGTQEVPDSLLPETSATQAGKKPLIVTRIPQEDGGTRIQKTDPETGMVISDRVYKKRQKKGKTWNPPVTEIPDTPSEDVLYSLEDTTEPKYQTGRMNKRLLFGDKFALSRTLKQIAQEENKYTRAPNKVIQARVEARMSTMVTIEDALRDIYKLRRMGPDRRAREFDPNNEFDGIGTASVIYYLHAIMTRLNLVLMAQDNNQDLDIDRPNAQLLLRATAKALNIEQREAGRGANINKLMLTYAPEDTIERLKSDLIRNNPAFRRYVKRALAFGDKYRQQGLTLEQMRDRAKSEGFPAFLAPALMMYSRDPSKTHRDFELEAYKEWAKHPEMAGHIKPETEANIKKLSMAAQNTSSAWAWDFYAQMAKLSTEAERGVGIIDSINAMFYNNILFAPGVALVNIVGTALRIPLDLLTYFTAHTAMDLTSNGVGALEKNFFALTKALEKGFKAIPEGIVEASAIALSGQRGTSVEAFTKAQGVIAPTQVLLYTRPGSLSAKMGNWGLPLRVMKVLLFDVGRRNATLFDAFYKAFSENALLGAELYREAWDAYQAEKPAESKSKFISDFIETRLNIKPLSFYQNLADQEIAANGQLMLANSMTILPSRAELSVLRNIIAFNLRREARELSVSPETLDEARRMSFAASFSNENKGVAAVVEENLNKFATVWGFSEFLGRISNTHYVAGVPFRASAGGALVPSNMPFAGNIARMSEEFLNWVGIGTILETGTNYNSLRKGKTESFFENNPDTYTKTEVAMSAVKGIMGLATIVALMSTMGGDQEDEDKDKGLVGFRDRMIWGRNGKEVFVPPFSFWWRGKNGDIQYVNFKDHPQLVATLGTAATFTERARKNPEAPWLMMLMRIPQSMLAGFSETGAYEGITELAAFFKEATQEGEQDEVKFKQGIMTNLAKHTKSYAIPLNRFQKETSAYAVWAETMGQERAPGEALPAKEFFPTLYANTVLEGWLNEEDAKKLDRVILPNGDVKMPKVMGRLGGFEIAGMEIGNIIKAPENAKNSISWMVSNGFILNRTDFQRGQISAKFTKKSQQDTAEAAFAKMNNGMFFVQHASEIESRAKEAYWPWIEAYSQDTGRKAELEAYLNSGTAKLDKAQGKAKNLHQLQQADINAMVTRARDIASLTVAADWYTDNQKVIGWANAIAAQKAKKGYKDALKTYKVNPQLEQSQ